MKSWTLTIGQFFATLHETFARSSFEVRFLEGGSHMGKEIIVATYNVLADGYICSDYYPGCDPNDYVAAVRHPRLLERVANLDADVICLQEVEGTMFDLLKARLKELGYVGFWARKRSGVKVKLDGCATFVRAPWRCVDSVTLHYDDGAHGRPRSGNVALITDVEDQDGHTLTIANTHLKWFASNTPPEQNFGLTQASSLLAVVGSQAAERIICGDFNAEWGSDIIHAFAAAGYTDAHDAAVATFNLEKRARKIDYLMHSSALIARPFRTTSITDSTPLPSDTELSDHIPLRAAFTAR